MSTEDWQRKWRCGACDSSFAFYSGNPCFLRFCVNCVAKIRAHAADPKRNLAKMAAQDTPEAWDVIADDWLDNGGDLPEAVTEKDKAEFIAWMEGGPSTPGAQRYGLGRIPRRAT